MHCALKDFAEGENVIKYGYPIGHALMAKQQGDWMNETNIKTNLAGLLDYTITFYELTNFDEAELGFVRLPDLEDKK